jgi:hypothetical protein
MIEERPDEIEYAEVLEASGGDFEVADIVMGSITNFSRRKQEEE